MSDYLHMSKNPKFGLNPVLPAYSKLQVLFMPCTWNYYVSKLHFPSIVSDHLEASLQLQGSDSLPAHALKSGGCQQ